MLLKYLIKRQYDLIKRYGVQSTLRIKNQHPNEKKSHFDVDYFV